MLTIGWKKNKAMMGTLNYSSLIENFSLLSQPIDKFSYLIDLGKKCEGIPDNLKIDENIIKGCSSLAWLICREGSNNTYVVNTDSDAFIVKGLLFLLEKVVSGSSKDEIKNLGAKNILNELGLSESITSQRTNGFGNALKKIKDSL